MGESGRLWRSAAIRCSSETARTATRATRPRLHPTGTAVTTTCRSEEEYTLNKTKIEWCDATWNPVTGCLHGCEYCYARRIAERFKGWNSDAGCVSHVGPTATIMELDRQPERTTKNGQIQTAPFPFGFAPTFHRYRLDEPQEWKKPQTIFVCSMADLFGEWVPDDWIEEVFAACQKAPQHRYLFLTKNPARYLKLAEADMLPCNENFWYGSTATGPYVEAFFSKEHNTFVSIEPLLEPFEDAGAHGIHKYTNWAVIGAETGNRAGKVVPEREWIEVIVAAFRRYGKPVYMKDSIAPIVGEENMRREFPWEG